MNGTENGATQGGERSFYYGRSLLYTIFRHAAGLGERTAMDRAERISRRAVAAATEIRALPA